MKKNNKNEKRLYILTRETLGMTIMLFSILVTVMLLTNKLVFGGLGTAVCTFMYGTFGYGSYFVLFLLAYLGEWLTFEKRLKLNLRASLCVAATIIMLFMLFHAVSSAKLPMGNYGSYLSACYHNAAKGFKGYTAGGVISGLLVYPVAKGITFIGAYVAFALLAVLFGVLSFLVIRNLVRCKTIAKVAAENNADNNDEEEEEPVSDNVYSGTHDNLYSLNENREIVNNAAEPAPAPAPVSSPEQTSPQTRVQESAPVEARGEEKYSPENLGRKILFEPGEFAAESYRRNRIYNDNSYFNHPVQNDGDYLSSFSDGTPKQMQTPAPETTYTSDYSSGVESRTDSAQSPSYLYGDSPTQNLAGQSAQLDGNGDYSSYTVNESAPRSYGSTERYSEPAAPVDPVTPPPAQPSQYDLNRPIAREYREEQPPIQNNSYQQPVQRSPFDAATPSYVARPEPPAEPSYPTRAVPEPIEEEEDFSELSSGFDDYVDDQEIEEPSQPEEVEPEDVPVRNDPAPQQSSSGLFNLFSSSNPRLSEQQNRVEPDVSAMQSARSERSRENIFDEDDGEENEIFKDQSPLVTRSQMPEEGRRQPDAVPQERGGLADLGGRNDMRNSSDRAFTPVTPVEPVRRAEPAAPVKPPKPVEPEKPKHVWKKYVRPSLELLDDYPENSNVNTGEIEESKRVIVETLASFRIASQVSNVVVGPAITRYDVIIEDKTNIKNALKYREAVAMALMKENVTAYLNYSRGAISIEVPNSSRTVVGLKGMLASSSFINAKSNSLTFTLGKNVEGQVVCPDITKMPHLLVAGTTGSGKSICLSTLIISLLYKYGPEELRFILVDPKQVEFISYDKLPHLMINEIIYDVDKAIKALNWAIKEMERRYQLFKEMTEKGIATKNLTEYNQHLPEGEEKLPKIVVILDEFGDLMLQAKKDIESRIIRLVQKARACGIHLILATQRPSVDCITGLIKSNLPTRIGFKVNSFDDARTIFDIGGAEKLLGKGDMYFRSADNPELARIQGCFVDTHEVQRVTDFIKQNNETYFDQSVSDFINTVEEEQSEAGADEGAGGGDANKVDDTFIKALKFCVTSNQASVSMIQRRFPIGYMKACKIIDWMETMNYITRSEGSKPRKVLLSREEFIQKYGDIDD